MSGADAPATRPYTPGMPCPEGYHEDWGEGRGGQLRCVRDAAPSLRADAVIGARVEPNGPPVTLLGEVPPAASTESSTGGRIVLGVGVGALVLGGLYLAWRAGQRQGRGR